MVEEIETTEQAAERITKEVVKDMKRNPRGDAFYKVYYFKRALAAGKIPLDKSEYKKHTLKSLKNLAGE